MVKRLTLLVCACALMFLAACGGSKGGGSSSYRDRDRGGDDWGDGGGGEPPPRPDELRKSKDEATSLTDENHRLAREIFELKNRMGLSTDD